MLDLLKLHQFAVLARSGSYTSAAAALHVSQPTLTRVVQSLEATLKVRLVDRGRHGVTLTALGAQLLSHAEDLLQHATGIEEDMVMHSRGVRGRVRIGAGPSIGARIIPEVVVQVASTNPDISIRTVLAHTEAMHAMLLAGDLDFFIALERGAMWSEKISTERIGYSSPTFFVREGHPLAERQSVSLNDIGRYPRIAGTAWNEALPEVAPPEAVPYLQATVETDDSGIMAVLIRTLDAILVSNPGLVPTGVVPLEVPELGEGLPGSPVSLHRPARRTLPPAVHLVMGLALDAARSVYALGRDGVRAPTEPT